MKIQISLFYNFVFQWKRIKQGFFVVKTQSVTGSYHADKLSLVILTMYVNLKAYAQNFITKT